MFWLRLLYVCNGLAIGLLFSFVSVLLQSRGFEPALVGLTTGLGSLGYMVALPAWGHVGDIVSGPRRALQMACIPAAVFGLGLAAPIPVPAIIFCHVVLCAGGAPTMALTDAMAMPILRDPAHDYPRLRLLTSLGGGVGAIGGGLIYAVTGYLVAPVLFVFVIALTFLSAQFLPLGRDSERHRKARGLREGKPHQPPERGRFGSAGEAVSGRPRLVAALVSVLLIFFSAMAAGTYLGIRITDLGGSATDIGLANGIGSFTEAIGLLLAGWLASRLGLRSVLLVSAAGFSACVASWAVLESTALIIVTRAFSGLLFAGVFMAFVLTVSRQLPYHLQSTGQTLFQAVGFGLAAVLANLLGGILYASLGSAGLFGCGAMSAVAGALIGYLAIPATAQGGAPVVPAEATPAPS
jgi:MFS family permease